MNDVKHKEEHKADLDCEITVFEGAHNTCDQTEGGDPNNQTAEKASPSKEAPIKDNYNI
ncbi:MAG: hypothetical protein R3274_06535 [Desulfobacterales bacterium]|nr:hypothetical protein [Desulfobacterales bacterium]